MEGTEIDLIQMLDCRERRGFIQNELLGKYHCPVISFCMNIPGPIKTNPQIREAFLTGLAALTTALEEASITVLQSYDIAEPTGDEWIAAVDADASKVKELTMEIENRHPFGRLFDIDVIGVDGVKLSRPRYRKCLICGKQAQECARMRNVLAVLQILFRVCFWSAISLRRFSICRSRQCSSSAFCEHSPSAISALFLRRQSISSISSFSFLSVSRRSCKKPSITSLFSFGPI